MNFFKSVFSDDPEPPLPSKSGSELHGKSPHKEDEEDESDPNPTTPSTDSSSTSAAWSFGGLIKTISAKSESVIETYRRDLQEFGSGLKKEIVVAQGSLETVGHAFDDLGSSVLKGTAQIIAQGKDALLSMDHESDSDNSSNQNYSAQRSSSSKPYSRFDAQVRVIQGDMATYCEEPEDVDDYNKWKLETVLEDKSEEIEILIEENGAIDNIYSKVVPNIVDNETFWFRYFYRVYKLKQAEDVRANLVKRAFSREEEEELLGWDDDDDEYEESTVGLKGDVVKNKEVSHEGLAKNVEKEEVNVDEMRNVEEEVGVALKDDLLAIKEVDGKESDEVVKEAISVKELEAGSSGGVDKDGEKSSDEGLDGDKESDRKPHLEDGSGSGLNNDQALKSTEKVAIENESDHGESSKDSDLSVVSTQPSMPEDEDLGWDEIEDLSCIDEKKVTHGGITNREETRKRLSAAEEDEDLSWGTEDDEEPIKA